MTVTLHHCQFIRRIKYFKLTAGVLLFDWIFNRVDCLENAGKLDIRFDEKREREKNAFSTIVIHGASA